MILIISTCADKLHETEFVKPIENVLKENKINFISKFYKEINDSDLSNAEKIIISGTSLEDYEYLKDISLFFWLKKTDKPVLGICSGMQIIGLVYGSESKENKEIGFYKEVFDREFLGLKVDQEVEVYHLHNSYITLPNEFEEYSKSYPSKVVQAIKHKEKEIYGVLFHPEVRNHEMIVNFCL
jgi:GMP synthase-like glutamine amidotransferase